MTQVRVACQSITFGEGQSARLPEILGVIGAAGYEGVELGFRHIAATSPEAFRDLLDANELALAATHLGGNLDDPAQAKSEHGIIQDVLEYLAPLGTRVICYSGLNAQGAELDAQIDMLNRAADRCAERGVRLCYHNHHWEFADDWAILKRVLERKSENLWFCPDVGWVAKAGCRPTAYLDAIATRLGAVHFKDFGSLGEGIDTVELGTGVVDFSEVASWLRENVTAPLWVIAEQDRPTTTAEAAVAANAAFLRNLFAVG